MYADSKLSQAKQLEAAVGAMFWSKFVPYQVLLSVRSTGDEACIRTSAVSGRVESAHRAPVL